MNDQQTKQEIFERIWFTFRHIEPVLDKAGIPKTRLPEYEKTMLAVVELPLNKMRHTETWLKEFITKYITPWKRIRAENPESYWENVKMMGFGNLGEVQKMNELSKGIRRDWFSTHNVLVTKRKEPECQKTNE